MELMADRTNATISSVLVVAKNVGDIMNLVVIT
jgi:hypothetical protein